MRVLIIGGTGHIGRYLVRHFVNQKAEVIVIARGQTSLGQPGEAAGQAAFWEEVRLLPLDREVAEKIFVGTGGQTKWQAALHEIAADVVIDLVAFRVESTRQTIEAIRRHAKHFVNIGTGWRFGETHMLPTREEDLPHPRNPYGEQKQAMWELIRREFEQNGFAGTQLDPPALQGAPKVPNAPTGLRLLEVHQEIADGKTIQIPGTGETLLGMVHVADVAQLMLLALEQRDRAAGEAFNVTSDVGFTYNGLFDFLRGLFGSHAEVEHVALDEFERLHPERTSRHHTLYHQLLSNEKAKRVLGFAPRNDLGEILRENFHDLVRRGLLKATIH
ncbi:MAG: NAD-dependent epimerase/dehydratase family protein [Blastocatellia bacterium]